MPAHTNVKSPQFFYFDMGNVLLSFDYWIAARKMAAVCGATPEACYQAAFESELYLGSECGRITVEQFHRRFGELTHTTCALNDLLEAHSDMFTLLVPTARIVTQLKAVRHRTGLFSNTCADHLAFCRRRFTLIREFFDVSILSYELGVMKPNPAIYEHAIAAAGVPPELIFYTDDRQENVAAAQEQGIDAVLFTSGYDLLRELHARRVPINL